jgi:hypothetical protein
MSVCKSYQRQIAMLSVQALSESESAAVSKHLRDCAACRAYAKELEGIVRLYAQDAERPIAPGSVGTFHYDAVMVPWFKRLIAWPAPAIAAAAAIIVCAVMFWNRPTREGAQPAQPAVVHAPQALPSVPTIGNSRHLTTAELDQLTEVRPSQSSRGADFVFSVRSRDEGL